MNAQSTSPGFLPIGNGVYLHRETSPDSPPTASSDDPNLILVFGWMGAKLPHLLKYTKVYEEMYPHATQILVQSNAEYFWSSDRTRTKNLLPAADVLETYTGTKSLEPPRILVHSFSNGGGLQMYTFGNLLRSRNQVLRPTISAMVIDSSPGLGSLSQALQAFSAAIPSILLRIPLQILIAILYTFGEIQHRLFGIQPLFARLIKALLSNDGPPRGGILPWMNESTPRLYVCSKTDELVPVEQILAHFEEAKGRGLNVKIDVYEDTPHVAHARQYPERYWGAVKDLWKSAVAGHPQKQ
ncbi:hypothetical protein D9757_014465 [Collybiopsis confluens]|uniref:Indole-diterpene biosynthesis protein PaxU n=1 Tax=Collybiopsis confluens TaxID=2823264 RepID=A0A8H5CV73_9AGAR|nr:hypothetical protein D9757_014465 [Collybiopsis confluens]